MMATETTGRLFPLGQVVATPGALEALEEAGVAVGTLLARHAVGDWGDLVRHVTHLFQVRSADIELRRRFYESTDLPRREIRKGP